MVTANRLKNCVRKSDIVTRLGGDEFLVVMQNLESKASVESMANKLLDEFNSPFIIELKKVKVEASVGVTIYFDKNTDLHTLIQLADEAMYQAKNNQELPFIIFNTIIYIAFGLLNEYCHD